MRAQSFVEDIVEVDVAIRPGAEGVTDELAGMGDGEALEEDGVGEQEDGGVGADAEGQGDEGDDRIAWGLTELAQRVAKILGEGEHRNSSRSRVDRLQVTGCWNRAGSLVADGFHGIDGGGASCRKDKG